jgi:cytochrome b subunit of formate dehydrogenase
VAGLCALLALALLAAPTWAQDPDNCLFCHQYRGLTRYDAAHDRLHLFFVQPEYVRQRLGPHARLACTDCHPRAEVARFPHEPVSRVNCTQTCHLVDTSGRSRRFTHQNVADMLERSAHPSAVLTDLAFSGGDLLADDQSLCLYCHDEPVFRNPAGALASDAGLDQGTFDRCQTCHAQQVPVDVMYYTRHIAARLRTARPALEMSQVCAVCHDDPQVLEQSEMHAAVASYVRSFHGKAALLGDQSTANCVSCHAARGASAHLMLGKDHPDSAVHPTRVADSCRSLDCHPRADQALAAAGVHLDLPATVGSWEYLLAAAFIFLTVTTFGPSMLIVVLELLGQVIGRKHHTDTDLESLARNLWADPAGRRRLTRFTVDQRIQHWLLAILFTLLVLTGFPMKFADQPWAAALVNFFGGLGNARFIHHWAGVALVIGFTAHLVYALRWAVISARTRRAAGERRPLIQSVMALPMWVSPRDGLKMLQLLGYLMYLRRHPPTFGRFTVKEKFEYIGVFWGTTLLGLTGLLLWGASFFSHYVSGRVLNLALIAHTYEAFLAIIHVGILHIINVMLKPNVFPLSLATLTGKTPTPEMAEEHSDQVLEAARDLGLPQPGGAHE